MKTKKLTITKKQANNLLLPMILIVTSLMVSGVLIVLIGKNPIVAYSALFQGSFGSLAAFINTLNKAVPICFAAFAVLISQKGGTFNIGVEGQLLFGAFGSTIAGVYLAGLPFIIHIPITLLSGALFAALWSLIPAVLFVKRGLNLIVIFLLMNSIASFIMQYLILEPFASENALIPATNSILASAKLPYIIKSPNKLSVAILIVIGVAVLLYLLIYKTTFGFEMRTVGNNRNAAEYSGINTKKYMFMSLILSGMLAGLCGSIEVMGNHHRLYNGFSPGYGFDGIPIALLSRGNPIWAIFGSILFGALRTGSLNMQAQAGVSDEIVSVIQGSLIVFIAGEYIVRYLLNRKKQTAEVEK